MPRSGGITVSGVVVIIGSAFTLLLGVVMLLSSEFLSKTSPAANVPLNFGAIVAVEAVVLFAFGGWGLASGIGLICLKRWARISLLIFAGFLVCVSLPAVALMAVISLPTSHDPNLPPNFMPVMRIGMALFYGMFAALGGLWLYFFNRRNVKEQFQPMQAVSESVAGDLFLATAIPAPPLIRGTRPLSITIIGWFLLIGSAIAPLGLVMNSALFPDVQVPLYFLGFFLFGRNAYLVFMVWMVAQMAGAVGLLKLRNWGLFATICLQCLTVANVTLLAAIPGHRARFQLIMEAMTASMNARMPQPAPFDFPAWAALALSVPIVLVILYFLITRREAFASTREELAPKVRS